MSSAVTIDPILAAGHRPKVNKWLVTLSVTFGTLMGTIDTSIVNVALPQIRGQVGATLQEITWISTGYVIAQVIVMPFTGFLGRLFGQKNVYMFCLALFLLGSVMCGLARTLPMLIAFRAIQGLGAGALQPTEQAILRQTFSAKEQGMAMAVFALAIMLGPAIGPTLGGYIVDHYHWAWIFYINVPVGLLGLYMVATFVPEPEDIRAANRAAAAHQRKYMDWAGMALLVVGLSALQYVLEEGQSKDWFQDDVILACAAVSIVSIVLFVIRELTAPVPAVNLSLFKDPVFLSGSLIGAVMFAMLMGGMFLLPVFMQELLGFTATQSGLAMMPRVAVMAVATPIVGRIYNRVDPRLIVATGVGFFGIGAYLMSHFTLQTSQSGIVAAIMVQGVGFSCLFVPLTTTALSNIPRHKMADATGLNSLLRQIGGSIGLAIFTTILSRNMVVARAALSAHIDPSRPEVQARLAMAQSALMQRGMDPVAARAGATASLFGVVVRQSTVIAFQQLFLLTGIAFLGVLPILVFLKRGGVPDPKAKVHVEIE
ncbi:MAG: DHA2 family efflux MFS transporter permease subunit [Deltaproteobacteria bacterium]